MNTYRVFLKSGSIFKIKAHHFEIDFNSQEVKFYKSETDQDSEVFVAWNALEAIAPGADDTPSKPSRSVG
jgi:hypothetical protein